MSTPLFPSCLWLFVPCIWLSSHISLPYNLPVYLFKPFCLNVIDTRRRTHSVFISPTMDGSWLDGWCVLRWCCVLWTFYVCLMPSILIYLFFFCLVSSPNSLLPQHVPFTYTFFPASPCVPSFSQAWFPLPCCTFLQCIPHSSLPSPCPYLPMCISPPFPLPPFLP